MIDAVCVCVCVCVRRGILEMCGLILLGRGI